ncbi:hypothetical protein, partial [Rhizobium sp. IMFF44]|uniref:hypothetical protein n=1 Tax=Rhizobium sp. IMFF44 TaxID=3342350 RepID=UPI0035B71982
KLVRCLAHSGSTFSEVGASGKPGAVHNLLKLASDQLKTASALAAHPLFDTSTCCANQFHATLEPKNERSFNLGA